mgnify:CR=1 FL=1
MLNAYLLLYVVFRLGIHESVILTILLESLYSTRTDNLNTIKGDYRHAYRFKLQFEPREKC